MKLRTHLSIAGKRLKRDFFERDTVKVAKELLGKYLILRGKGKFQAVKITETEAYLGPEDKACHSAKGRTKRTKPMWGPPGTLYVYLVYGIHHCLNFVTERKGFPAAVLLRGAEPVFGVEREIDGPAKICKALGITKKENGLDITKSEKIFIKDIGEEPEKIIATPRIGVDYAEEWAKKKLRFCIKETG